MTNIVSQVGEELKQLRIDRSARPAQRSRVGLLLLVLMLLLGGSVAAWRFGTPKLVPVRTAVARESAGGGGQRTLLNGSGYVTARREATVSSKVTGKVIEVLVEEGMRVEAGQVLARIDPSNVETNLRLAEARANATRSSLNEIKVRLGEAERDFKRVTELAAKQIATPSDLDRAEAEVKSLRARLDKQGADVTVAEREVAVWQQQLEDTVIRAPFSGVLTVKNAQPGEMISPMSAGGSFTRTGICTIVDMNSLEIEVDVNESFINRVTAGQSVEATLDAYPDWKIPNKVIAIIPTADRQKATVKVRVGFEKLDPRILPHMGVKVAFQETDAAQSSARADVVVPKAAVRQDSGRDVVWVVRDGRTERRAVTIGATRGDETAVVAGLNAGEMVVIEGAESLRDGSRVRETKR